MEQLYTKLPNFISGQILKSRDLNDFFGYNEEQNRLTRSDLMNHGIVNGLKCSIVNGKIVISKGCGVTPDGHLIHLDEDFTLTSAERLTDSAYAYELHPTGNTAKVAPAIPDTGNLILVLTSEYEYSEFPHCSQNSCDINATDKREVVKAYLLQAGKTKAPFTGLHALPYIRPERCSGFSGALNINILLRKTKACFHSNKKLIADGMFRICKVLYPDISEASNKMLPSSCWESIFHPDEHLCQRLLNVCKKFKSGWHDNLNEIPVYYLQFFEDMILAINEFTDFYNEFACRYPLLPSAYHPEANALFLGIPGQDTSDPYRSYLFRTDSLFSQNCQILERMLMRIVLMSEKFIEGKTFDGKMRIRWQQPDTRLGARPIPYYYDDKNGKLTDCWTAPRLSAHKKSMDYALDGHEKPGIESNGRLYLQGIYDKDVHEMEKELNSYFRENHLDIKVLPVKMVKKTLRGKRYTHPNRFYSDILKDLLNRHQKKESAYAALTSAKIPVLSISRKKETSLIRHSRLSMTHTHLNRFHRSIPDGFVRIICYDEDRNRTVYQTFKAGDTVSGDEKGRTYLELYTEQLQLINDWKAYADDIRTIYEKVDKLGVDFMRKMINAAVENQDCPVEDVLRFNETFRDIHPKASVSYLAFCTEDKDLLKSNDIFTNKYVAGFNALISYYAKSYETAYEYAEIMRGYGKGNTVLLLHYYDKVFLDICL